MKCRPEKLDVSRAVMREAFGALAALKQLDVANGRRAKVGALDGSVLADSFEHAISTAQIGMAEVWDVRRTIESTPTVEKRCLGGPSRMLSPVGPL